MTPDPYCWPGSDCLRNKLGINDTDELRIVESRIVAVREVELLRVTIPGEYTLQHLKQFHAHLFGDVYDWAGESRTVNISKPGSTFAAWRNVDEYTSSVLSQLSVDGYLLGRTRKSFVERLSFYYSEINAAHPFREGNGRTQRAFLRQLSAAAGWRIDWSELNAEENVEASRHSLRTADTSTLQVIFDRFVSRI